MELERRYVNLNHRKGEAFSQMTMEEDLNVPDQKPDIYKIIHGQGEFRPDEIKGETGKIKVCLLYTSFSDACPRKHGVCRTGDRVLPCHQGWLLFGSGCHPARSGIPSWKPGLRCSSHQAMCNVRYEEYCCGRAAASGFRCRHGFRRWKVLRPIRCRYLPWHCRPCGCREGE